MIRTYLIIKFAIAIAFAIYFVASLAPLAEASYESTISAFAPPKSAEAVAGRKEQAEVVHLALDPTAKLLDGRVVVGSCAKKTEKRQTVCYVEIVGAGPTIYFRVAMYLAPSGYYRASARATRPR